MQGSAGKKKAKLFRNEDVGKIHCFRDWISFWLKEESILSCIDVPIRFGATVAQEVDLVVQ